MDPYEGSITLIVNPCSGHGGHRILWQGMYNYLLERGFSVQVRQTSCLGDARILAQQAAVVPGCAMVIAAGGDGTAREVADGLAGSGKPLMLIPAGTENLLASEIGMDDRLHGLIDTFQRGQIKVMDLGLVNQRCFACVVGVGFDGQVVQRVNKRRKGHIDYYDYLEPLWHTFWSYRFPAVNVQLDGKDVYTGRGLVFIGNISRYALGLHVLANAQMGDGLLDVCIYKSAGRLHLLKHSLMTILKRHTRCRDVVYSRCSQATISSVRGDLPCQVDGDPGPPLPLYISVRRAALKILVPPRARPLGVRQSLLRAFR